MKTNIRDKTMRGYTYRITNQRSNKVIGSGSIRGKNMDDALLKVLDFLNIKVRIERYDEDSIQAGEIFRTYFVNELGTMVHVSIAPMARYYVKRFKESGDNK